MEKNADSDANLPPTILQSVTWKFKWGKSLKRDPKQYGETNDEVHIDIDDNVEETQEDVNPSRDHVVDILEPAVQKAKETLPKPPPPYPQRLAKKNRENQFKKFIDMMKSLLINSPLVEALEQMSGYAKFTYDLVTKKRSMNCETIKTTHQVSAIVHSMTPKLEDPGAFTIPCIIGIAEFAKVLCDLGASINLMPYSVYKTLGIRKPRTTSMRLQMADRTMKRPLGVIEDVLVRCDTLILLADFIILDCEVNYKVPIILGRPFLTTGKDLVDVEARELTFRIGDEKVVFHVCKSMRQPNSNKVFSFIDLVTDVIVNETSVVINVDDTLEAILLNIDDEEMEGLLGMTTPHTKPSTEDPPILELKPFPAHLQYEFLVLSSTLPVIHSSCLTDVQINLEEGAKPSIEHQRRLNESMQVVVKKDIIKWLDAGVVYPISVVRGLLQFNVSQRKGVYDGDRHGMVEDYLEVYMEDFSVVRNSFDDCLANLDKVLARCEEINLVLNWEKCHFIVEKGIFFGDKISKNGIEVDKAKIDVISKLPPPTSKDAKFHFNDDCIRAIELLKFKLTTTLIITTPNWSVPFELMCNASDVVVGTVLEQYINKIFHLVYYASKTMNSAQVNYTVTEKELLAIVFAIETFLPYLMGAKVIVHTDHAALRYLMNKKDYKPRLMRWVLLLQEFYIDIQDLKGSENQVADHLSCLEEEGRPHDGLEINDSFPDKQHLAISMKEVEWFANLVNFLVSDGVIRRCVLEEEKCEILGACNSSPYSGYHGGAITAAKVLSCGFYWPTLYKDAGDLVKRCDEC
ncbi:uncharacterized protein [Nicotiana sylvestris]|uniref:uncharacterized protein n=1 Tax=Nicotiana sylvestris TaxID=4096 RepID=UPI00388C7061